MRTAPSPRSKDLDRVERQLSVLTGGKGRIGILLGLRDHRADRNQISKQSGASMPSTYRTVDHLRYSGLIYQAKTDGGRFFELTDDGERIAAALASLLN